MDVTRALRGAKQSGLPLKRLEIDSAGKIVLSFTDPDPAPIAPVVAPNPWDEAV
jgi:hypothetical protein